MNTNTCVCRASDALATLHTQMPGQRLGSLYILLTWRHIWHIDRPTDRQMGY